MKRVCEESFLNDKAKYLCRLSLLLYLVILAVL